METLRYDVTRDMLVTDIKKIQCVTVFAYIFTWKTDIWGQQCKDQSSHSNYAYSINISALKLQRAVDKRHCLQSQSNGVNNSALFPSHSIYMLSVFNFYQVVCKKFSFPLFECPLLSFPKMMFMLITGLLLIKEKTQLAVLLYLSYWISWSRK